MRYYHAFKTPAITEQEVKHAALCRQAAAEGMVLLENNGVLPFDLADQKIALYGPGARHTIPGGTGSGEVNSRHTVSAEEGLKNAGAIITTGRWLDRYDQAYMTEICNQIDQLREKGLHGFDLIWHMYSVHVQPEFSLSADDDISREKETAIYLLSRNAGEGNDRKNEPGDYQLSDQEKSMLLQLRETYHRLIIVLNVGGVIDTAFFREIAADAVLLMGQPGMAAGDALADVLSGSVNPCGHLTATWAAAYADYPNADRFSYLSGDTDDEYYTEGIYVGYRWFDRIGKKAAYPFGYGMSYTTFTLKKESLALQGGEIHLKVAVNNVGEKYAGRAVVQLYVSAPEGKLHQPIQTLKAFAKSGIILPGGQETVTLAFPVNDLASWDENCGAWILEPGGYVLRMGQDSSNTEICGVLSLTEEKVSPIFTARFQADGEMALLCPDRAYDAPVPDAKEERLSLDGVSLDGPVQASGGQDRKRPLPSGFLTMEDLAAGRCQEADIVGQLTPEELTKLCLGIASDGVDETSMIGNASMSCPGAGGETTALLTEKRHIPNLILADGPAGLRLSPEFITDENHSVIWEASAFGRSFLELLPPDQNPVPAEGQHWYQYCSAIPTATLLAQTWDMALIQQCGNLVGEEMLTYGVTLWLAPALNIQRNPLCGRNFEYYSEDPLLSGLCAAAMTKGVQEHPGIGTTIKHFACNNQEDNRAFNNSHVPERALREIYLKGFEIAVRRSRPKAVMTSYNLLNGTHTANSTELITGVLRNEWGFQGLVMTDWGTTDAPGISQEGKQPQYGCSSPVQCIRAGNDLIMPGSQTDVTAILRAVEQQELSMDELRTCAARVVHVAAEAWMSARGITK